MESKGAHASVGTIFQKRLDRTVESARAKTHAPTRLAFDLAHDLVTVKVSVDQRKHDLKSSGGERV